MLDTAVASIARLPAGDDYPLGNCKTRALTGAVFLSKKKPRPGSGSGELRQFTGCLAGPLETAHILGMKRFDDEFDWHADQKRGALARMVDRLLEVLRRSFLDPFAYRERDD